MKRLNLVYQKQKLGWLLEIVEKLSRSWKHFLELALVFKIRTFPLIENSFLKGDLFVWVILLRSHTLPYSWLIVYSFEGIIKKQFEKFHRKFTFKYWIRLRACKSSLISFDFRNRLIFQVSEICIEEKNWLCFIVSN